MFGTDSQIDADFYRLIHRLVPALGSGRKKNHRSSDRRPFSADGRIAPLCGPEFPEDSAFISVRAHDLSRSGFAFFLPNRPDFTRLVAAFNCGDETLYVGASVVHCRDVLVHSLGMVESLGNRRRRCQSGSQMAESGTPMILVGCRFTERLEKPARQGQARP
jgi:hypothetical protein